MSAITNVTTTGIKTPRNWERAAKAVAWAWAVNPALTTLTVASAVGSAFALVGMFVDSRVLTNAPIWAKPAKFAISSMIYGATILVMFGAVQPRPNWARRLMTVTGFTLCFEMLVIFTKAARGKTSHFNTSTPLDTFLWFSMAAAIYILFAAALTAAYHLCRQKNPTILGVGAPAFIRSIKIAMLVTVVAGMGVGNLMVIPTPIQMEKIAKGDADAYKTLGGHTCGAVDGGPGLPFLGWSTTHGDLRAAHFLGLHALQIIPLFGFVVIRLKNRWSSRQRVLVVTIFGACYSALVVLATTQALRGESIVQPSSSTLTAFGAIILIALSAVLAVLRSGHGSAKRPKLNFPRKNQESCPSVVTGFRP